MTRAKTALPKPAAGYYRVQAGDTLYKIAFEHGQDMLDLVAWNQLADPNHIRSGETLRVLPPKPAAGVHAPAVQALPRIASPRGGIRPPPEVVPAAANPPRSPAGAQEAAPDAWAWPLRGPLLARFGEGLNKGIDIAGQRGQAVRAAASGRVVYVGSGLRGYGKLIIIRHGKTLLSAYAHNSRILVAEGDPVTLGQTIAEAGDSDAERVKLHFEIREMGRPVDPLNFLPNAG